jgi:PAS domain S-box-containing protein
MKTSKDRLPDAVTKAVENAEPRAWYPLVLIFAIVASGIFAGGFLSYRNYERHFRTRIEEELSAITELKVGQIVRWRRERLADANFIRRTPYAARRALDVLAQPASLTTRQNFTAVLEALFADGSYERALLLDEQLNVGLVYPEGASGVLGEVALRAAQQALRSHQVVVADLHRQTEDGPVYLSLVVPFVVRRKSTGDKVPAAGQDSSPTDRSAGLLVLEVNAQKDLYPLIQFWPTASRTAETLLVRREGNDALFLNNLKFRTNAALKLRFSLARTNVPAVKAALGQEGIVEGTDYRGEHVLGAVRAIPDTPWRMVARMDLAEVYAPQRERLWLTILLMAALLLGAGASVGMVWRQQREQFYREKAAASEMIQASEERYRTIMDQAADAIFMRGETGRILEANRKACQSLGYSREELLAKSIWDLDPEALQAGKQKLWSRILAGEQFTFESHQRRKDGSVFPVEATLGLVRLPAGPAVLGIVRDITERKRVERALRETEERFRRAVVDSPFPVLLHAEDGAIIQTSNSWCEITGYTREELATIADWTERAYGERKTLVQADVDRLYGLDHRETQGDYTIRTKSGDLRIWEFSSAPLGHLPDGRRLVISMAMDVTERRQAEAALRENEMSLRETQRIARLGGYVLHIPSGVWSSSDVLDTLFGIDEDYERSVAGWVALVHPDDRRMMDDYFRNEVLSQGRTFDKEYRVVRQNDQAERWVHGLGKLEFDAEGRPLKMHGTIQDITERRQAEEKIRELNQTLEQRVVERTAQLEVANKELESFSYSVSHDLRAPLRAIDGFARILDEDYTARLDDEGRRLLGVICAEARRMGQLIDDLLAFSRMSRQQVELAQIDMTALAQAVFDEQAAQAPGRQLRFKVQPLPPALGDRALLRQVLANLISNAIKYTRSRAVAEIEIGGRTEDGQSLYYVKDNGVGFDMRYAGKLFGVFQRLHTEAEFEGNGVGLALVQRVIHRHGGRVWAEGKLNEGSTFYFTLPIRKDET